jgi:hypothetical protein
MSHVARLLTIPVLAMFALTLALAASCDDSTRRLTEDEAEEEFAPDCDAIYDACIDRCGDNSPCQDGCDAAKDACENQ